MESQPIESSEATPPAIGYAQPDTDPAYRDDDAGLLVREALDHPFSWAVHGLFFVFVSVLPVGSWAWKGFHVDPNPLKAAWAVICGVGFATWGVFALMRPTNWREVYFDLRQRRVNLRWRRWLRPGGASFELSEFDRVVIVEQGDGDRYSPRCVELRRPWATGERPAKVVVRTFASNDELERLAKRIAERTGLRLDRYRDTSSS